MSVPETTSSDLLAGKVSDDESRIGWRWEFDLFVSTAAILAVAAPLLFTNSAFGGDFTNHLWLTWVAGHALAQAGHPSYFVNASGAGVFYPWFAFYGGSLYAIVGGISELSGGHPVLAYVGVTAVTIAATYTSMVWLARQIGLLGWASHAPALAVVTSAYYITDLYGRGDWTEFMATSAIAPLLASSVHLVRAERWRPWPLLVFVVSAVIFSGSHNITLLWGSTIGILMCVTMWLAVWRPRPLPARRLAMLGGLGAACVLLNAWYLIPDVSYAGDVMAHGLIAAIAEADYFDAPQVLLDPLRSVPAASTTPGLFVQAPVWFLGWSLVAGLVLRRHLRSSRSLRHAWISVAVLTGVLLSMIMYTPLWAYMPPPFDAIQFPYRLGSYVFYASGGLVLVGALALQGSAAQMVDLMAVRRLRLGLIGVCVVSIGLCVWQQWVPNLREPRTYIDRQEGLVSVDRVPRTWADSVSYNDEQAPVVAVPNGRSLWIDPSEVHGDKFAAWMRAPAGLAPIRTNIAGGDYLVHISGLSRIGRTRLGYAVVRREREGSGAVHVVVQTASGTVITLAWVISAMASVIVLLVFVWACVQSVIARRLRRRGVLPADA